MQHQNAAEQKPHITKTRRVYMMQLVMRCIILIACILLVIFDPQQLEILEGWNFFRRLSPLHLLWLIWMLDMIWQIVPVKKRLVIALGSQKHFKFRFQPVKEAFHAQGLRQYIIDTTKAAYKVFAIWAAGIAAISLLYTFNILDNTALFLITLIFYVCDLICVLIWCPFRLIVKARCCTTCRIFNWDHLMMFSPLLMVSGFFARTLVLTAIADWLLWELCIMMYPERFWENSNASLRCANCTDKLCTQYCGKHHS